MYKLVVLGLAAAFVVKANPALQEGGTPPIIFGDADFDDLAAQGNSIGSYGELTYSNLYVEDLDYLIDANNFHGIRHISSGNNVAVFPDTIGRGAALPAIKAAWRKGVVDSFTPSVFNWGCFSRNTPCQLVVTGHRGGRRVASATFTASTDLLTNEAIFNSDFANIDKLKFHPHRAGYARRQAIREVTWIDNFRYVYYIGGRPGATGTPNTISSPTTTETTSDVIITITPTPTLTTFPEGCGTNCFTGLNDCLEPISSCFSGCLTFSFAFNAPDTNLCSTRATPTAYGITSVNIDTDLPITTDPADWDPATWCEICVDNIDECGQTFGGCFNTCNGEVPTFETPSCSLTATDIPITTETTISPGTETPILPTATPTSAPIDHTIPLSQDGRCGTDAGTGFSFNERCGDDACCSMWGWCGPGPLSDWCDTCQPGFGFCTRPIFEAQPLLRFKAKNVTHHH